MTAAMISTTIPPSNSKVSVKAINPNRILGVPPSLFLEPNIPGTTYADTPSLAFLIEHVNAVGSQERLLFDLGFRKDWENLPPSIVDAIKQMNVRIITDEDVVEQLVAGGISLSSIDTICFSHQHMDHIGDTSLFPASTKLIVGPGFIEAHTPGYPTNASSPIPDSALVGRELQELEFSDFQIGGFQAKDYFGDGSLYFLSTPGHTVGHVSALARVQSNSFVFLGGDVCHHAGELRPTNKVPLCNKLYQAVHPQQRHDSPFYKTAFSPFNHDTEEARRSVNMVTEFDADPNIMILLAHDNSLLETIDLFPKSINDWKDKGWKERNTWQFLSDLDVSQVN